MASPNLSGVPIRSRFSGTVGTNSLNKPYESQLLGDRGQSYF